MHFPETLPEQVSYAAWLPGCPVAPLLPGELQLADSFGARRRDDFARGRSSARTALRALGVADVPVLRDPAGAPCWPPGVVGSITHCDGFAAAVVGGSATFTSLAIDAERDDKLPEGVSDMVLDPVERCHVARLQMLSADGPNLDTLIFCIKEAVYKLSYPICKSWVDFQDVSVRLDLVHGSYIAHLRRGAARDIMPPVLSGLWTAENGLLLVFLGLRRASLASTSISVPAIASLCTAPITVEGITSA